MARRYFKLTENMDEQERWLLGIPIDEQGQAVGAWVFLNGEPVHVKGRFLVPIKHPGEGLDYSLADMGGVPVVTEKVARVFNQLSPNDVQIFPATVIGQSGSHFLLNVVRLVKCIDDEASGEVGYWEPEDGQPERLGQYHLLPH